MTAALDLNAIAQTSAVRILDCLVGGTLITILAAGLLQVRRRATSSTRFAVWFSAMITIALLALVGDLQWVHGAKTSAVTSRPALVLPSAWALYIFLGWAVIATFLLVRVGVGLWHLYRLRRSCVPWDADLVDTEVRKKLELEGRTRRIALCISDRVKVPTAIGFFRPAVVLPAWLMEELTPAELTQFVLHEFAHLRRWDDWTNLAQKILKALLFFHPAVWWIEKKISLEREMACDDAVIAETANPRAYAECLAHLAEISMIRRSLVFAQAALGRIRQTSLRVARILRRDRPATSGTWKPAVVVVAGFAVLCVGAMSRAPHLIAFEQEHPRSVIAQSLTLPQTNLAAPIVSAVKVAQTHLPTPGSRPGRLRAGASQKSVVSRDVAAEIAGLESSPDQKPRMVQPARFSDSSSDSLSATPTLYFVVESREYLPSGVVVFRASVWRVTVMPATDNPRTRIPRKET